VHSGLDPDRFRGDHLGGSGQHGRRRVDDGNPVTVAGKGKGLVSGAAADVNQIGRGWREMPTQVAVDDVGADPAS
jgi:hypothetical protein